MIDIIIPTYNRAKFLVETLKSVQSQTFHQWQCWIAEDGQTQETLKAITPFLKDKRFKYLPGEHAGRPSKPRNRAIREGIAKYIAFLDDDDIWLPDKLQLQIEFMERHPGCVLLGCNAYRWSGSEEWNSSTPLYFQKRKFSGHIPYDLFVQENYIILSSAMIRRVALERSGLFNESLLISEDYELWLRIGALGEIWNISDPLLLYRDAGPTYYPKYNRQENYKTRASILLSALEGVDNIPSPLSYPENRNYAAACDCEKKFYLAGPCFLGRLRHELMLKIKRCLNRPL
ncbi:MAG: glycosyltransferase [Deltaproteobacteria bacterium]|nr:glycosyltransferase [Deltaproteobacteria bacterium]